MSEHLDVESEGRWDSRFRSLVTLREIRDQAQQALKAAEKEYREYEAELWEMLEDNGHKSMTLDLGGEFGEVNFQRRETIHSRVLDLDTLLDSLEQECRLDELTKPGIEKKRLNELVRDRLEAGEELPEGADFYSQKRVFIKKKKG